MADRFLDEGHAKVYASGRPSTPKVLVDRVLQFLSEQYDGELSLAVDVGCGSGQNTFPYADHFKAVIGTDVSGAQVEAAADKNDWANVVFRVAPAHEIPAEDGTVQLVTAATAAHWFDLPLFFQECERVLCPGGVVALYSYTMYPTLTFQDEEFADQSYRLNDLIQKIYSETLEGYWDTNVKIRRSFYQDIVIPLRNLTREDGFVNTFPMNLRTVEARLRSSSAFQTFSRQNGAAEAEKIVEPVLDEVRSILGDKGKDMTPEEVHFDAKNFLFLVIARK